MLLGGRRGRLLRHFGRGRARGIGLFAEWATAVVIVMVIEGFVWWWM